MIQHFYEISPSSVYLDSDIYVTTIYMGCSASATKSFFFKVILTDTTCPILGPLVPLFWISGDVFSGFQSQSGFYLIHLIHIGEVNVMYIPWDPPLVLHKHLDSQH